jgi:glycosyltransferase involved in cell wall biosynthesis
MITISNKLNILYIQHVGVEGGSFKSLFVIVKELSEKQKIKPYFITVNGINTKKIQNHGFLFKSVSGLSQFDNGSISKYKGLRWLILIREILLFPISMYSIIFAYYKWKDIDIIHVNEITLIGVAVFAKLLIKKPVVLHVRSMQAITNNLRKKIIIKLINKYVDFVIPIDSNVASTVKGVKKICIIHNCDVNPVEIDECIQRKKNIIRFGIVANYLRYKGIEEFVEAAEKCIRANKDADLRFLIFGDNQEKNSGILHFIKKIMGLDHDVKEKIISMINDFGMIDKIQMKGFVSEPKEIYSKIDVLVFPSRLDAVGRPVFEAANFSRPSIVTLREKRNDDSIIDGVTGFVVKQQDSSDIALAMQKFIDEPSLINLMGCAAKKLANENYNLNKNSNMIYDIYKKLSKK